MNAVLNGVYVIYGQVGRVLRHFENQSARAIALRQKPQVPGLSLYQFQVSYFSIKARNAIYKMGVNIPFIDVLIDHEAFEDLIHHGGKDQVPCLRIDGPSGTLWMYETDDILAYLAKVKN
jgi:hypothetical protein